MKTYHLTIHGMSCGHCVKTLTQTLRAIEEISVESVGIGTATVKMNDNLSRDTVQTILTTAVSEAGFALSALR